MGKFIFNALSQLFGPGLSEKITVFLGYVIDALESIMTEDNIMSHINIFLAIGCSLMTIFLFMDILDKATKEMLSFERLVLVILKWFLGCAILIYLPDLIYGLFRMMDGIYEMTKTLSITNGGLSNIQYFPADGNPDPSKWPEYEAVYSAFKKSGYEDNLSLIKHFPTVIVSFLVTVISFGATIAAFLFSLGNAVSIIVRTLFSPIAVAQCFEDGQRSNAIRYLKKIAADMLTFGIIVAILYACSQLQGHLAGQIATEFAGDNGSIIISVENIPQLIAFSKVAMLLAVQCTAVGGIMKANSISNDIVGV